MVFEFNPIAHRGDRLTDDGFYAFCQANPSLYIERKADGQIVFQRPSNTKTSLQNADLSAELVSWNRKTKSGLVVGSSAGYTLPDTSVRVPDVSWFCRQRWDALPKKNKISWPRFARISYLNS